MNYRPLHKRVLVHRRMKDNVTPGGVIMGDPKPSIECEVLAISKEIMEVNVGDVVIVDLFSGTEVVIDNKKYLSVAVDQILGIMEEK